MAVYQTTEYNGKIYREVKRKANVGELIRIVNAYLGDGFYENGDFFTVRETYNYGGDAVGVRVLGHHSGVRHYEYVVLEEIGDVPEEPTPQLAGIHDSLAKLALEVSELKRKVDDNTNDIAFLDEKRLAFESLTPLQLAILNAKDTPAETKLALIVEAGRLESERQAKLDA